MTGKPKDDIGFAKLFEAVGPSKTADILGVTNAAVYQRRVAAERRLGRQLTGPVHHARTRNHVNHPGFLKTVLYDGVAVIGSDAHNWPGKPSTAHRGYLWACKELKPKIVFRNGDELDGARISRHAPIGWETRPSLIEEIEACKERTNEVVLAAGKAERYWPLGNHDARFETRLATMAPEYAKIHGVHLQDHFPDFQPCWGVQINEDVIVKHRFKGGIHATHNNTMWAGKTMVTGHLHSLKVTPFSDYNGTRYGVDCGTLADPYGPQFADYTELNPVNWRSGFAVLTFDRGRLLPPELVQVFDPQTIAFRGQLIHV